ncbi:uncharacterized protein LOC131155479 [Malania oleifera]|uniref:uncharacterized protein LOC131155479 n=1 Tax=Malania oleifera TaxID=397392 RepID=UPI0025ADF1DB|nr:uncharacterized protein LOC131155479 [Malania oleifera]
MLLVNLTYELIRKILRGLPPVWEAKATAIAEGRNLKEMSVDELIGSLITYELAINERKNEQNKTKKVIALKAASNSSSEGSDSKLDDNMMLITKKFEEFMKKNKKYTRKFMGSKIEKGESSKRKQKDDIPMCYNRREVEHIKLDCPQLKKVSKKKKKKTLKVGWDTYGTNSSEFESSDDEIANLCLMAHEDHEMCLRLSSSNDKWHMGSGFSRHMIG